MRISDTEVRKILQKQHVIVQQIVELEQGIDEPEFPTDPEFVKEVARKVMDMPDREEMIAELKERIERGEYSPTGDDVAEAMIRRAIADRIR